jgi:hypothetical protein
MVSNLTLIPVLPGKILIQPTALNFLKVKSRLVNLMTSRRFSSLDSHTWVNTWASIWNLLYLTSKIFLNKSISLSSFRFIWVQILKQLKERLLAFLTMLAWLEGFMKFSGWLFRLLVANLLTNDFKHYLQIGFIILH